MRLKNTTEEGFSRLQSLGVQFLQNAKTLHSKCKKLSLCPNFISNKMQKTCCQKCKTTLSSLEKLASVVLLHFWG